MSDGATAIARALARSLGHNPGEPHSNGVVAWATCTKCRAPMVRRLDRNDEWGGAMTERKCKKK